MNEWKTEFKENLFAIILVTGDIKLPDEIAIVVDCQVMFVISMMDFLKDALDFYLHILYYMFMYGYPNSLNNFFYICSHMLPLILYRVISAG